MLIRRIRKSDYAAVDRLLLQLQQVDVQARPDRFAPMPHYMPQDSFACLLDNDNIVTFLALEHGRAVGCCFASLLERNAADPQKTVYIDLLVVDENYRRRGIGRALFAAVRRRAAKYGAGKIELMVWSHNQIAMSAYRAYGMTPQRSIYEISV